MALPSTTNQHNDENIMFHHVQSGIFLMED